MKINKQLDTELIESMLLEADDLSGIDTSSSVADIADEVAAEVSSSTAGAVELDGTSARKVAAEVKEVSDDLGLDAAAVAVPEEVDFLGVDNEITKVLDNALRKAKKNKSRGSKSGFNVLIIGLPGSGKTASIEDWAKANGVNLVSVNAKNNDLDAYINGYVTKRPDDPLKVTQAFSDNLAGLEKENSVLFLDEYNRQIKPNIRASLYTLINEHKIVGDGPNRQHEFKNMLFTVAAINPSVPTDKGAAPLNDAEKSRFWWIMDDMDSDAATTIEYLKKYYNKQISRLNPASENYREDLEEYLRIQDLGIFIVSHPKFNYDTRDDLEDLHRLGATLLCQRALTNGLHNAEGDVTEFKLWVENGSKFLKRDIDMLVSIIRDYVKPSFEDLRAGCDVDLAAPAPTHEDSLEAEVAAEVEDDDDFFPSAGSKGSIRAKNPYEVEVTVLNALKDW
jgi:hypothetical protein